MMLKFIPETHPYVKAMQEAIDEMKDLLNE